MKKARAGRRLRDDDERAFRGLGSTGYCTRRECSCCYEFDGAIPLNHLLVVLGTMVVSPAGRGLPQLVQFFCRTFGCRMKQLGHVIPCVGVAVDSFFVDLTQLKLRTVAGILISTPNKKNYRLKLQSYLYFV